MNHAQLPAVDAARLPASYEHAKTALAECSSLDECKDWSDKAAALASYARQSKDESLTKMSQRIQARAIRRAGELLKQIMTQHGANQNIEGGPPPIVTASKPQRMLGYLMTSARMRCVLLQFLNQSLAIWWSRTLPQLLLSWQRLAPRNNW